MKNLHDYKKRIEREIAEYAEGLLAKEDKPLKAMMECYAAIDSMDTHNMLTPEDIVKACKKTVEF